MERLERIRGCFLAGAAGDALGYQVEFTSFEEILRQYGPHGVRTMAPHISDDTQMTLFTAEGLLMGRAHRMPMPACVYQSYLDWYRTQYPRHRGGCFAKESLLLPVEGLYRQEAPGITCMSALGDGSMGTMDEPINRSKGCGGVMRTAPCGMLLAHGMQPDEDAYALQGAMAAAITHSHLMGYVPAAMLADMVHMILLEDGRTLKQIVRDSLSRMMRLFAPRVESAQGCEEQAEASGGTLPAMLAFGELILRAMKLAESDVPDHEAIVSLGKGWVGDEALAIAVFCALRYQADLAEGLCAAVNHGGDSDSTGAIAGNILGAWLGASAIPEDWLDAIVLRGVVEDMALRIHEAAGESMA